MAFFMQPRFTDPRLPLMACMRLFACLLLVWFPALPGIAQYAVTGVIPFQLPDSIRTGSREFSSMARYQDRLFLLPENRNDRFRAFTAGIYSLSEAALSASIRDTTLPVSSYQKHSLVGIEKIQSMLPDYQGLEAIAFHGDRFFITVETDATDPYGYLLTGLFENNRFVLDTTRVFPLKRPVQKDGSAIFNAGFESLCVAGNYLYAFYEFNYFKRNYAYRIDPRLRKSRRIRLSGIPFRLTDVTSYDGQRILAINYFFPLPEEKVYQQGLPPRDRQLIGQPSALHPFARLLLLKKNRRKIRVVQEIDLPEHLWGSNWEGLVPFENGILLLNDKYTPNAPESQLVYISLEKNSR